MAAFISDEERKRILAAMLSGQVGRRPPPVQATAATPLPGVPMEQAIIAPQSEQAVKAPPAPPQYDEFAVARQMLQARQAPVTGNKDIDAILASQAQAQSGAEQNLMNILKGAQMNPLEKGILEARRARAQKEQAELEKEQKLAGWDALARAGFAMAQSNSPYFMQALASGLEAGVKGLDESKLKADEKRARLQAAEEDTVLAEIRGNQAAQERMMAIYNAARAAGKSEIEARDQAIKSAVTLKTLPQQLEMADLEVKGKKADLRLTEARIIDTLRGPSGGGGGGSAGPKAPSATAVLEETGKFTRDLPELRTKASDAFYAYQKEKDPQKKAELKGKYDIARDNYRRARDRLAVLEGRKPGSPYRRSVTGEIYTGPQRTSARPAAGGGSSPKPKSFPGTQAEWNAMTAAEKKLFQ